MEELMLLENPRGYRYNPKGWYGQPNRHSLAAKKGKRRNPMTRNVALAMPKPLRRWTQGVDLMDVGAAVGGMAMSTLIPGRIVRNTSTIGQKFWKLTVSFAAAVAAGIAGKAISPTAGKSAIIGGLAGTGITALGMWTNITIGQSTGRKIGEKIDVLAPFTRTQEDVQLIRP